MQTRRYLAWLLPLALIAGGAAAQNEELLAEAAKAPPVSGTISPYVQVAGVSGESAWAGRYLAPNSEIGLDIHDFSLRGDDGFDTFDLWARGLFGNQRSILAQLWTRNIPARLRVRYNRHAFVGDPWLGSSPLASDSAASADLMVRPTHWIAITGGLRRDENLIGAVARGDRLDYRVQDAWAGLSVDTGIGVLGANFSTSDFTDYGTMQPSTSTQAYGLSYDAVLGTRISVSGTAKWARVRRPGSDTSTIFAGGLAGSYSFGPNLEVHGRYRYRDLDYGPTANAYLARSQTGGASVTWRPSRAFTVRAGLDFTEGQRFNALQNHVEKPRERRAYARAEYRASHDLRVSLAYQRRDRSSLWPSARPYMFDNSVLFYDTDQKLDLRFSRQIGVEGLGYAFYQYRELSNDARGLNTVVGNVGLGVSVPITRGLIGSADWFYRYTNAAAKLPSGLGTDSLVLHAGLGWQPASKWRVAADYHWVRSFHGQSTDGSYLALGVGWQASDRSSFELTYSRDGYDGGLFPQQDYDTDVVRFTYRNTF